MAKQSHIFKYIKWSVLIAAYAFLIYKLITFEYYNELKEAWNKNSLFYHWSYLLIVFLLLPFNWLFETLKWKYLLRKLELLSLKEAFKSVMIGNTTAFFTPNRLGEFPGRSITLSKGKKLQGTTIGILGSISQTLTIMLLGIPCAWMIFFFNKSNYHHPITELIFFSIFFSLLLFYFLLPRIANKLKSVTYLTKIRHLLKSLSLFSFTELMGVFLLSFIRYIIFCTQFYFLLNFFGVVLDPLFGGIAIAANYLFVTFTPSWALSEGAVRASVAVLVIGTLSTNVVGIAVAGLCIWLINFVIPMLIGSVIFSKTKY